MENTKKITLGKIIKILCLIIAILILIIACQIVYKANKYPDKVPDIFGYKPMIVLSGSMEPTISTGDLVLIEEVNTDLLKEGDIISFTNETKTITTHRIVSIVTEDGNKYFKTKGDNNNTEDPELIEADNVEGRYIGRIRRLGNVLIFAKQPVGMLVIILIILMIGTIWLYMIRRKEEKQFQKEYEENREEFEEFKRLKQEKQDESNKNS